MKMKKIVLLVLGLIMATVAYAQNAFYAVSPSGHQLMYENSLFVDSSERKYLKNLPVTYEGFGKTVCDSIFDNSLNMYVKFYTALDFSFNNHRYYLPMVDSIKCVKFQDKHFGDTLFVNMVLLDATSCDSNCLFIDGNCAYITQISDKK